MNTEDFNRLPANEQLRIIFKKAQFVDSTEKDSTVFALYCMEDFFIELEYDLSEFRLSTRRVFKSGPRLNKYLDWDKVL